MSISDHLTGFENLGRLVPDRETAPSATDEPVSHLQRKGRKRGRWKPPPEAAKWSDLYGTCATGISTALEVCRDVVGVVERGDRMHIVTSGWWSMEQPICVLGEQLGPVDMWMISWAVNDDAVLRLVEAMDRGFIRNVRAVIDERMKVLRPAALDIMQAAVGERNLGIMACHAKAYVLRQVDGDLAVAMVTSANWSQNPRPESLCIDADPRATAVYAQWVDRMLDTGKAKPYQHSGKLASELMSEDVQFDREKILAPGLAARLYPTHQQIKTWKQCRRKWWIIYMAGVEPEPSKYALHGKVVHAKAEAYLKGGGAPGEFVAPVVGLLPSPGSGEVEAELLDHDSPLLARVDWIGMVDGVLTILDHKTSKTKKREKALRRDSQAMLYAWISMTVHLVESCRLRWVWYDDQTVTEIDVTLEQAEEASSIDREIAAMLWADPPDSAQDEMNKKSCYTCEVKSVCPKLITIGKDNGQNR
jgi:CRISPR/Cas system-associated exonuclease Cas4 (RecB family)